MPSTLHEESLDHLKDCFMLTIANLPYDHNLITPRVSMNTSLQLKDKSVTPNMVIKVAPVEGPRKNMMISGIGECALSEGIDEVFVKVGEEIEAHPEIKLAMIVKTLHNGEDDDPSPLPLNSFVDQQSMPQSLDYPMRGKDGSLINIHDKDPENMAYGTLMPDLDMEAVTTMLGCGLHKIRDSLVTLSQKISPNLDCLELQNADIALDISWPLAVKGIMGAADVFGHEHYQTWQHAAFRGGTGKKCMHNASYCLSPLEAEASTSLELEEASTDVPRTCYQTCNKGASTSQASPPNPVAPLVPPPVIQTNLNTLLSDHTTFSCLDGTCPSTEVTADSQELLSVISALVSNLGVHVDPTKATEALLMPLVSKITNLQIHKGFEHKEAADAVLLAAIPLNLEPSDQ
ncbi:hypothetical protein EV702DRAFT_1191897 [Suillus placidus]|uniref:Uncharacterized protein n=1 Tax=Suillus placidus TaxID=48579 RepID=A0A9P7A6U5_9AGAM|nr:hypothetical protein EV702DRAFT_1191897 [Suillus placidus]